MLVSKKKIYCTCTLFYLVESELATKSPLNYTVKNISCTKYLNLCFLINKVNCKIRILDFNIIQWSLSLQKLNGLDLNIITVDILYKFSTQHTNIEKNDRNSNQKPCILITLKALKQSFSSLQ